MKKIKLIIRCILVMIVLTTGCIQKGSKIPDKATTTDIQKSQEPPLDTKKTSIEDKETIYNEISNTDALDMAVDELGLIE